MAVCLKADFAVVAFSKIYKNIVEKFHYILYTILHKNGRFAFLDGSRRS